VKKLEQGIKLILFYESYDSQNHEYIGWDIFDPRGQTARLPGEHGIREILMCHGQKFAFTIKLKHENVKLEEELREFLIENGITPRTSYQVIKRVPEEEDIEPEALMLAEKDVDLEPKKDILDPIKEDIALESEKKDVDLEPKKDILDPIKEDIALESEKKDISDSTETIALFHFVVTQTYHDAIYALFNERRIFMETCRMMVHPTFHGRHGGLYPSMWY